MDISIIVPNYNGQELLKKNLPKIFDALGVYGGKKEVIVVDDASSDDSLIILNKIEKTYPYLKVVVTGKNMGFSSAVNKGVEQASGNVVILLNSDVYPEKNFLRPLLKNFSNDNVFAVGCMDKSIENGKTVLRGRGLGKFIKGFLVHRRGQVDEKDTLWVSCGSGAFRKDIWRKIGGLDELYNPFYWEDIDISYRAIKSGFKILFEPKSVVTHIHEEGSIKTNYPKSSIKKIAYRNQFIFIWKNITDLDYQFLHIFWLPYHMMKALFRCDVQFFLGFLGALFLIPKIVRLNLLDRRLFVKLDKEII